MFYCIFNYYGQIVEEDFGLCHHSRALAPTQTRVGLRLCFCVSNKKGFMSLVRGGVEGKMGRYNVPPHLQQS